MNNIANNYRKILSNIELAKNTHSAKQNVTLLAVSKTKPVAMIRALYEVGQRDFGENYLQEAIEKICKLSDLEVIWHYIGHIQRNKTRDIAQHFAWVHTVERDIIAKRLSDQRPDNLPPLNVCIQVNIDNETSKSGVQPNEVLDLVTYIQTFENLRVRGLMVIPSKTCDDAFLRTKKIFDDVAEQLKSPCWDTLSMGMSADFEQAIAHGSTIIRVGSALFGARG